MQLLEILYGIGTVAAIIACLPQMHQLMVTKRSDEFSLSTWVIWLGGQAMAFIYISSLGETLVALASACWTAFYAFMVGLILYYRRPAHQLRLAEEEIESQ